MINIDMYIPNGFRFKIFNPFIVRVGLLLPLSVELVTISQPPKHLPPVSEIYKIYLILIFKVDFDYNKYLMGL